MKTRDSLKLGTAVLAVLALGIVVQPASATVVGHLDFAQCVGQDVTVSFAVINFLPNLGPGCIVAGSTMAITSSSGNIGPADIGSANDLNGAAPGAGNAGFITFGSILFNLASNSPGPGATNTNCALSVTVNDPSCSVTAGSPFILAANGSGTTVTLIVNGLATDSTSTNSVWSGAFTTQVSNMSPLAIRTLICGNATGVCNGVNGGSITDSFSFSGDSVAGAVPEPVSMALIGGGLIAFAFLKRRKSRA